MEETIKIKCVRQIDRPSYLGLIFTRRFVFNFQKIMSPGFNGPAMFVLVLGVFFIIWGILGFRSELRKLSEIK
jgi:hypothetical protein